MNFYLGVWNSPMAISDDEVAARYRALSDEKSVEPEFDDQVYTFYSRLTSKYPEIEMVPEDELDACPWASGLDVAGFDPQAGKIHLPPYLSAPQVTSDSNGDSGSQPPAIQPNGELGTGGDALKPRPTDIRII